MKGNNEGCFERVVASLARERAQTKPDNAVMLSVLSGSSVLALTKASDTGAFTALSGLVRLFL